MKLLILENPFKPPLLPERMTWTSSSVKLFRRCKRKWFWKYVMRLHPRHSGSPALMIGGAFHELLGEWYKGKRAGMAAIVGKYEKKLRQQAADNAGYFDQEDSDKLTIAIDCFTGMMLAYEELYKNDRRDWKIDRRSIEAKFKLDMVDFDYAGKTDLVANSHLVEHKTTSKISETYIDRLPLDTQIRGYIYGARNALNLKFNSVLYDVVLKSKLRRKSNETMKDFSDRVAHAYVSEPTKYFYREDLRISQDDLDAFRLEISQTHREFKDLQRAGAWNDPRNWMPNDHACTDWFRTCEYHKLCTVGLDRGTGINYSQGDHLNEELADEE